MLKFSVESLQQVMERGGVEIGGRKAISGLLACVFSSWKVCMENFVEVGMVAAQLLELFDFLIFTAQDQSLNFVVLTKYSLSWRRSDSYLAFSP